MACVFLQTVPIPSDLCENREEKRGEGRRGEGKERKEKEKDLNSLKGGQKAPISKTGIYYGSSI